MPEKAQPYQPPNTELVADQATHSRFRFRRTAWLLAYLYPLLAIGSLYGIWLIAWRQLGHMPQPNVDDPKSIGGVLSVCWFWPMLFLMGLPFMSLLGFVASFRLQARSGEPQVRQYSWTLPAIYILLCVFVYGLLFWDPLSIVEWCGD